MISKMYRERRANIPVFRGCDYNCVYCEFDKMLKLSSCPMCKSFTPHSHMEILERKPPKTKEGEFLTFGLSSDVSFMKDSEWLLSWAYLRKWSDRTFLIQSKNPAVFLKWQDVIPENVILGTTIESNRLVFSSGDNKIPTCLYDRGDGGFEPISQAPAAFNRYENMCAIKGRKAITIEPIMEFDVLPFASWILNVNPEICWIGYDSHPEKNRLIEPSLYKVDQLVKRLKEAGINVKLKLMREPIRTTEVK